LAVFDCKTCGFHVSYSLIDLIFISDLALTQVSKIAK
jgi:hypothetical protein